MIVYKHDECGFALTAYEERDGKLEPVAWLAEAQGKWFVFGYVSIREYASFTEAQAELEKLYE